MAFVNFLNNLDGIVWGMPMIILVMATGIYYTLRSGFFSFRFFGHAVKNTVLTKAQTTDSGKDGKISPYRAFCIALGSAVGMGNISGVATSIAVGGPGALFWMILWAFVGMMVKTAEVSLGLYYRRKDNEGKYRGSAMDYMKRGISGEMGYKIGVPLAFLFGIGLFMQFTQGSGTYAVAETLNASFGLPLMLVAVLYTAFVVYLIIRGENTIGRFAEKIVPIMCGIYLVGALLVVIINFANIPAMIVEMVVDAFSPTSAVGGFAGAAVSLTIRQGVARAIYSNEAGNGTSPLIHGSADTIHPVRQGLWGAVEVFCDTCIVCLCTGLAILSTNVWQSGSTGAALGVMAFTSVYGVFGKYFVGIMTLLFAMTTSTGWYIFYQNMLSFLLGRWPAVEKAAHRIFTVLFPATMIGVCAFVYYTGSDAGLFWTIVSIATAFPVFFNCIALFFLRKKFFALLKDYKARYLGIGTVDPNFIPFAEDDPAVMNKIRQNLGENA